MDVNKELKFLWKFKKIMGGLGSGRGGVNENRKFKSEFGGGRDGGGVVGRSGWGCGWI